MYWTYSRYSLLLKGSDAKQHLKMFLRECFKEMQEFMIKFPFIIERHVCSHYQASQKCYASFYPLKTFQFYFVHNFS